MHTAFFKFIVCGVYNMVIMDNMQLALNFMATKLSLWGCKNKSPASALCSCNNIVFCWWQWPNSSPSEFQY